MPIKTKIVEGVKHFDYEDEKKDNVKLGIDTNIFVKIFESGDNLKELTELGGAIYTSQICFDELCKYVKKKENQGPNEKDAKLIVDKFMEKNGIFLACEEVSIKERIKFEQKCKKLGIDCHYPDSEIILAFKKEGVEIICSEDKGFKEAAEYLGMEALRLYA